MFEASLQEFAKVGIGPAALEAPRAFGVYEERLPGPTGFIGLIAGIWLIRRENQERSMARGGEN